MNTKTYSVTFTDEAFDDLRRLQVFLLERELASDAPDWSVPERALEAIREGMKVLRWSPFTCRRAQLGNGSLRELIIPFGNAGYIALFDVIADRVVVGAVRHQRDDDYRH